MASSDRRDNAPSIPAIPWPGPDSDVAAMLRQMAENGTWGQYAGPHCNALRASLSTHFERQDVQLCCSGTAAVELCLRGVNVSEGDEVILAGYDFKANFVNILTLQAVPVVVDTIPGRPEIDPKQVASAITDRTRAVIVSHLHGCHAAMAQIVAIAQQHGIAVIEDACQNPGALVEGQVAGSWGQVSALSFGGSKLLSAGRGGAVLTNDSRIHQRIRLYTQRGNDAYPMSEMQAAVLLPQLEKLKQRNQQRSVAVGQIRERLAEHAFIELVTTEDTEDSSPAFYKVAFRLTKATDRQQLEQLSHQLRQVGVPLDPAFHAIHLTHSRRRFRSGDSLEHAAALHHQLMTLHHPILLSDRETIDTLCNLIDTYCSRISW